jgi:hypothetical protein
MLRINDAVNFRRTLAGLALIAAPVLFGASDVLRISIPGAAGEGAAKFAAIADNIERWHTATVLNMLGVILFLPAILGLMHLLRARSVVLGHIGGGLALLGVLGWAGHNAGYFGVFAAAATADIERA